MNFIAKQKHEDVATNSQKKQSIKAFETALKERKEKEKVGLVVALCASESI